VFPFKPKEKLHKPFKGRPTYFIFLFDRSYTSQIIKRDFDKLLARITTPSSPPTLLITIFLGANDACLVGPNDLEYVPLSQFASNIREFVETILIQDALPHTKIVLITPPPINILEPFHDDDGDEEAVAKMKIEMKAGKGYKTYLSKKKYAETIMQIAKEYEETERVVGVDFWRACVDVALKEQGRDGELMGDGVGEKYEEERLPGCGLVGAREFSKGYFTDGLHLGKLVSSLLW
jgi:lysophospholipase L1-like esterase